MYLYYNNDGLVKLSSPEQITTDLHELRVDVFSPPQETMSFIVDGKVEHRNIPGSNIDLKKQVEGAKTVDELKQIVLKML